MCARCAQCEYAHASVKRTGFFFKFHLTKTNADSYDWQILIIAILKIHNNILAHVLWSYVRKYITSRGEFVRPTKEEDKKKEKKTHFANSLCDRTKLSGAWKNFRWLLCVTRQCCAAGDATAEQFCTDSRVQTFSSYLFEVCLLLLVRFTNTAYLFSLFISVGCYRRNIACSHIQMHIIYTLRSFILHRLSASLLHESSIDQEDGDEGTKKKATYILFDDERIQWRMKSRKDKQIRTFCRAGRAPSIQTH